MLTSLRLNVLCLQPRQHSGDSLHPRKRTFSKQHVAPQRDPASCRKQLQLWALKSPHQITWGQLRSRFPPFISETSCATFPSYSPFIVPCRSVQRSLPLYLHLLLTSAHQISTFQVDHLTPLYTCTVVGVVVVVVFGQVWSLTRVKSDQAIWLVMMVKLVTIGNIDVLFGNSLFSQFIPQSNK